MTIMFALSHKFTRWSAMAIAVAALALFAVTPRANAQYRDDLPSDAGPPVAVPNPGITDKTGTLLPLDATFTESDGKPVKLGDLFNHDRPVIVSLVYHSCPALCGFNQQALCDAILAGPRDLKFNRDYDIIIVSFDPDDTPAIAASKRAIYQAKIGRGPTDPGFIYLTGDASNIQRLADAVGFGFMRNPYPKGDKFLHSTGIFVCTPEGRVSQTILGIQYEPDQLHYALVNASHGRLGGGLLAVALCCGAMHFDAKTGRYVQNPWFYAGTAGALLSIAFVAGFLGLMWRGEIKAARAARTDAPGPGAAPNSDAEGALHSAPPSDPNDPNSLA